jgi:hypothetical protein
MANPATSNAAAGDVAKTAGLEVISRLNDATGCSKGDIVHFDANGLAVVGVNGTGNQQAGFAVALEDGTLSTASRFAVGNSYVYVTAGEAIVPFEAIDIDATAGRAGSHTRPADSALNLTVANTTNMEADLDTALDAQRDYFDSFVGRYIGHQTEITGDPTDAADGDIIAVRLGL